MNLFVVNDTVSSSQTFEEANVSLLIICVVKTGSKWGILIRALVKVIMQPFKQSLAVIAAGRVGLGWLGPGQGWRGGLFEWRMRQWRRAAAAMRHSAPHGAANRMPCHFHSLHLLGSSSLLRWDDVPVRHEKHRNRAACLKRLSPCVKSLAVVYLSWLDRFWILLPLAGFLFFSIYCDLNWRNLS